MPMEGALTVGVIVWRGEATDGLGRLAEVDETALAGAELARIESSRPLPDGWDHLWRVGRTDIFCEAIDEDGGAALLCDCRADSGIIKYPVDVELDDSTRLTWKWAMRKLPSPNPENSLMTHDYMSIAVEFENGQDLTYFWSSSLPLETSFRAPFRVGRSARLISSCERAARISDAGRPTAGRSSTTTAERSARSIRARSSACGSSRSARFSAATASPHFAASLSPRPRRSGLERQGGPRRRGLRYLQIFPRRDIVMFKTVASLSARRASFEIARRPAGVRLPTA